MPSRRSGGSARRMHSQMFSDETAEGYWWGSKLHRSTTYMKRLGSVSAHTVEFHNRQRAHSQKLHVWTQRRRLDNCLADYSTSKSRKSNPLKTEKDFLGINYRVLASVLLMLRTSCRNKVNVSQFGFNWGQIQQRYMVKC